MLPHDNFAPIQFASVIPKAPELAHTGIGASEPFSFVLITFSFLLGFFILKLSKFCIVSQIRDTSKRILLFLASLLLLESVYLFLGRPDIMNVSYYLITSGLLCAYYLSYGLKGTRSLWLKRSFWLLALSFLILIEITESSNLYLVTFGLIYFSSLIGVLKEQRAFNFKAYNLSRLVILISPLSIILSSFWIPEFSLGVFNLLVFFALVSELTEEDLNLFRKLDEIILLLNQEQLKGGHANSNLINHIKKLKVPTVSLNYFSDQLKAEQTSSSVVSHIKNLSSTLSSHLSEIEAALSNQPPVIQSISLRELAERIEKEVSHLRYQVKNPDFQLQLVTPDARFFGDFARISEICHLILSIVFSPETEQTKTTTHFILFARQNRLNIKITDSSSKLDLEANISSQAKYLLELINKYKLGFSSEIKASGEFIFNLNFPFEDELVAIQNREIYERITNFFEAKHVEVDKVKLIHPNWQKSLKILVASKHEIVATSISETLRRLNYETIVIDDLEKLQNFSKQNDLALLILDNSLGDSLVLSTIEQIKASKSLSDIPILITSLYKSHESMLQFFKAGAEEYLELPVSLDEIAARIYRLISTRTRFEMQINDVFLEIKKARLQKSLLTSLAQRINLPASHNRNVASNLTSELHKHEVDLLHMMRQTPSKLTKTQRSGFLSRLQYINALLASLKEYANATNLGVDELRSLTVIDDFELKRLELAQLLKKIETHSASAIPVKYPPVRFEAKDIDKISFYGNVHAIVYCFEKIIGLLASSLDHGLCVDVSGRSLNSSSTIVKFRFKEALPSELHGLDSCLASCNDHLVAFGAKITWRKNGFDLTIESYLDLCVENDYPKSKRQAS